MASTEPPRRDIHHPRLNKKYSAPLRLWHWLSAGVIAGSLLTVLINSVFTNGHKNADIIKTQLSDANVAITNDQARHAAHEISDKVWLIHTYFGYTLAALLLFRIVLEFFQLADQKLIRNIKSAHNRYYVIKKDKILARHELVVKSLYALFYIILLTMVITGLCLAFEDDLPALKAIHAIREIHGFCMYLVIAFIIVHVAGVFLAERKDSKGIVSDMINGGSSSN